jgi:hypothetical protein
MAVNLFFLDYFMNGTGNHILNQVVNDISNFKMHHIISLYYLQSVSLSFALPIVLSLATLFCLVFVIVPAGNTNRKVIYMYTNVV